jgi:methionyl-tRNA synthetase
VLAFCYKHWDGHVPDVDPALLRPADLELLAAIEAGFQSVGGELEAVHLRAALQETLRLAGEVNKYLDTSAPWFEIKTDKEAAAKSVYTALRAIDSLKILFAPILPFSSEKLNDFFGYEIPLFGGQYTEAVTDNLGEHTVLRYHGNHLFQWKPSELKPGAKLNQPAPLFKKLEESVIEEERTRLGKSGNFLLN